MSHAGTMYIISQREMSNFKVLHLNVKLTNIFSPYAIKFRWRRLDACRPDTIHLFVFWTVCILMTFASHYHYRCVTLYFAISSDIKHGFNVYLLTWNCPYTSDRIVKGGGNTPLIFVSVLKEFWWWKPRLFFFRKRSHSYEFEEAWNL